MNIVYNSQHYAILAYPLQQGFELVDKAASRSLFVQGSVARDLRKAIDEIPDSERDEQRMIGTGLVPRRIFLPLDTFLRKLDQAARGTAVTLLRPGRRRFNPAKPVNIRTNDPGSGIGVPGLPFTANARLPVRSLDHASPSTVR